MKTIVKMEDLITYVAAEESEYKEIDNMGHITVGGIKSIFKQDRDNTIKAKCFNSALDCTPVLYARTADVQPRLLSLTSDYGKPLYQPNVVPKPG